MKEDVKQLQQQLYKAKHVLVALPKEAQGDHFCAAAALTHNLRARNIRVDIMQENFLLPKNLQFIKDDIGDIQPHLPTVQTLNIEIDITDTPLSEMSYDVVDEKLKIQITTKEGTITPKRVHSQASDFKYDTIITIGCASIESIGSPAHKAADMWTSLPTINIDRQSTNTHFGHINLVDLATSSLSEIIFTTLDNLEEKTLNKKTATLILTGIITATKSFKGTSVTPKLLKIVSRLMDMGADREDINNKLYRTRTLSSLKLWGAVLSRLQNHEKQKLVWSVIPRQTFIDSKTNEHELEDIIEEIILNSPQAEVIALLLEPISGSETKAIIATIPGRDARGLTSPFKGNKTLNRAHLTLQNTNLTEAEQKIIPHLKQELEKIPA